MQNDIISSFREAQSKLVVQTADLPLGTLAEMVEGRAIDLQPGFQRRERWSVDKQSALVESFLLNVPVPPVYLAEELDGTYTAIDGKQRLRAIADFIFGRFKLRNLERLVDAEGLHFEDLPSEITNSLKLRPYLRVVTLLKQTDPLLKYEVFLRLNRGGEALNAQEIRNVAFRGKLNERIYTLSEHAFLKKQLKIENDKSAAFRDMDDAEFVLRFLTLNERISNFSGSLVKEMDNFMRRWQQAKPAEIDALTQPFVDAIDRCESIWGDNAFKRPEGTGWRDQTIAGMFDAQMIAAGKVSPAVAARAAANQAKTLAETRKLFTNSEFDKAVKTGTNTPARIRYRVEEMTKVLEAI